MPNCWVFQPAFGCCAHPKAVRNIIFIKIIKAKDMVQTKCNIEDNHDPTFAQFTASAQSRLGLPLLILN